MATASALPSAKKATLQLVERLDDDVSFEDIIDQLSDVMIGTPLPSKEIAKQAPSDSGPTGRFCS